MSFFENTRKPVGFSGKIMVAMMNFGHSAMAAWGLHFLQPVPDAMVLDCGCGGGANIKTLLKLCPKGKEIFKPLNTGWIDENVACVREWVANIFFYRKGDTTIMIDAGYNYDRLAEKMSWLGIDPHSIRHILITHQDTDHVGAVEADSPGLFRDAALYIGETDRAFLLADRQGGANTQKDRV